MKKDIKQVRRKILYNGKYFYTAWRDAVEKSVEESLVRDTAKFFKITLNNVEIEER